MARLALGPRKEPARQEPQLPQYLQDEIDFLDTFTRQEQISKAPSLVEHPGLNRSGDATRAHAPISPAAARDHESESDSRTRLNPNLVEISSSIGDQFAARGYILHLLVIRAVLPEWYHDGDETETVSSRQRSGSLSSVRHALELSFDDMTRSPAPSSPPQPSRIHLGGLSQMVIWIDANDLFSPHILFNMGVSFIKRRLKSCELQGCVFRTSRIHEVVRTALKHVHVLTPPDARPGSVFDQLSGLPAYLFSKASASSVDRPVWGVVLDGWDEVSWPGWATMPDGSYQDTSGVSLSVDSPPTESEAPNLIAATDVLDFLTQLADYLSCLCLVTLAQNSGCNADLPVHHAERSVNAGITVYLQPSSSEGNVPLSYQAKRMPLRAFRAVVHDRRPDPRKLMRALAKPDSSLPAYLSNDRSRDQRAAFSLTLEERKSVYHVDYDTYSSGLYVLKL